MTESQIQQLTNIAEAMMRSVDEHLLPDSAVVGPRFAEEFRARLQAHHGTHLSHLDGLAFESAFAAALQAEGHTVESAPNRTNRFWDLLVDGCRVSVKLTAAKGLRTNTVHITKLCEATWIQDVRSARDREERTKALFREFLDTVDGGWFVLRIFRETDGYRYELVEIPVRMFELVLQLRRDVFSRDTGRISVTNDDGELMFQLVLDRADAKITIASIQKRFCIVHGEWRIHTN